MSEKLKTKRWFLYISQFGGIYISTYIAIDIALRIQYQDEILDEGMQITKLDSFLFGQILQIIFFPSFADSFWKELSSCVAKFFPKFN